MSTKALQISALVVSVMILGLMAYGFFAHSQAIPNPDDPDNAQGASDTAAV